jgi:hypothetical protein
MAYQEPGSSGSTTEVAREQASQVGQTVSAAGGQVAQTTKEQAQNVVGEAKRQARDLVGEARTQVSSQAGGQKDRAVQGLHALGDELDRMTEQGGQSGVATEVARQVSTRVHDVARYLENREPEDLLDEVRAYARRRPVVFLTGAALAGVVAGRLTRGLASGGSGSSTDRRPAFDTGYAGVLPGGRSAELPSLPPQPVQQPLAEQPPEPYPGGYPASAPPPVGSPAYPGTGYESTGYESGYEPGYTAPPDAGTATGPGGFRTPETDPLGGYSDPEHDPGLDPQQPPERGWTP